LTYISRDRNAPSSAPLPEITEGVESASEGTALVAMGCDVGQGFGIARPMAAEAVNRWLARLRQTPIRWDESEAAAIPAEASV